MLVRERKFGDLQKRAAGAVSASMIVCLARLGVEGIVDFVEGVENYILVLLTYVIAHSPRFTNISLFGATQYLNIVHVQLAQYNNNRKDIHEQ
ncbi:MAG: hypothetical protein NWE78_01380 [Candidatus Bathyarchaeota archaeon]|nr:hypothetical protein [Candidatus Bathyarchaeota archaeon]